MLSMKGSATESVSRWHFGGLIGRRGQRHLLDYSADNDKRMRTTEMKNLIARFVREDEGQDLIEYGLLIGIITVGCIAAILLIGPKVTAYFTTLEAALP
jgi:pilus assembly protein Flp/PilA